ncbi:MAG: hypothetical protein ACRC9R_05535, partial [Enterovibrio sp.]
PSTSTLGSAARQIVQRGRGIRMPLSAVRSAQQIPQTNTGTAQTQHRSRWGIFTHGLARQSGLGTPLVANTPPVYVPPAALDAQQLRVLGAAISITGDPNHRYGFDASQEECRMDVVSVLAQVLQLDLRHVNRHVPVGTTPIRDIMCAIFIGAGLQVPGPAEIARLIRVFIDAMHAQPPRQSSSPPNNRGWRGPNNGPGGASGGAAAGGANAPAGGAAAAQAANALQFRPQQNNQLALVPPPMLQIMPVRPAPPPPALQIAPVRPAPPPPTQQPQAAIQLPAVLSRVRPQYPLPPIPPHQPQVGSQVRWPRPQHPPPPPPQGAVGQAQVPLQQPVVRPKQRPHYPLPPIPPQQQAPALLPGAHRWPRPTYPPPQPPQGQAAPPQALQPLAVRPRRPNYPLPPIPPQQPQAQALPSVTQLRWPRPTYAPPPPPPQVQASALVPQPNQQMQAATSLPPQPPLPPGFPMYLVFGYNNILHPHDPARPLPANQMLIKTDVITRMPILKVAMPSGLLRDATREDVRTNNCRGTWSVSCNQRRYTVIVNREGELYIF